MSYYTGCRLTIELPTDRTIDEHAVRQALVKKVPGIDIKFISSPDAHRATAAEAFVPDNHPMAGMKRQDFGASEMKPVAAETLLGIAQGVLDDLEVQRQRD